MTISSNKNTNISIDKCGTTERYYDFGLHYDLCGMSIEDYIESNNACCCSCGNSEGGGSSTPSKKINIITFTVSSDGYLVAYTTYAPTINISASCVCEGATANFIFNANSSAIVKSDVLPINEKLSVSDVVIEPMEDDKYKYGDYTVVDESNKFVYTTKTVPNFKELGTIGNLSVDDLNEQVIENDGTTIVFYRPVSELPEDYNDPDFDYDNWVANNSYVEVFILNKNEFDSGEVKVLNGNDDISKYLHEIETITVNNEIYSVLVRITDNNTQNSLNYNGLDVITYSADTEMNSKYVIKIN